MDPLTHGLTGALIGKGFFAERSGPRWNGSRRVATFAATLGAIFPDIDIGAALIGKNDLAIIQLHRSVTHSFLCLPIFAAALAALTRWYGRHRAFDTPSWGALTLIYAAGLASHILLDLATSFGTMVWSPWKDTRVSWDLAFIVDFAMTGIALLPQAAASVYRAREGSFSRAVRLWGLLTAGTVSVMWLSHATRFPFSPWVVVALPLLLLALFFLPGWRGWGFKVRRSAWCRAGVYALAAYLGVCAAAHHAALKRVEQFAADRGLRVERLGALPLPPSAAHWAGLIRTPEGVYEARYNLLTGGSAEFRFVADAAPNGYIEAAQQLPKVKVYLWFARFPVFRFVERGERNIVEITDLRFFSRRKRLAPFTFQVTFDAAGHVIEQGWLEEAR